MDPASSRRIEEAQEWVVESKADTYARHLDYLVFKFTPTGQRGWADRLYININGVHVYIEYKKRFKTLRKLQEYRRKQLTARGVHCYGPVDDLMEAKYILDKHKAEMGPPRVPA